jgi:hypothetical protein
MHSCDPNSAKLIAEGNIFAANQCTSLNCIIVSVLVKLIIGFKSAFRLVKKNCGKKWFQLEILYQAKLYSGLHFYAWCTNTRRVYMVVIKRGSALAEIIKLHGFNLHGCNSAPDSGLFRLCLCAIKAGLRCIKQNRVRHFNLYCTPHYIDTREFFLSMKMGNRLTSCRPHRSSATDYESYYE